MLPCRVTAADDAVVVDGNKVPVRPSVLPVCSDEQQTTVHTALTDFKADCLARWRSAGTAPGCDRLGEVMPLKTQACDPGAGIAMTGESADDGFDHIPKELRTAFAEWTRESATSNDQAACVRRGCEQSLCSGNRVLLVPPLWFHGGVDDGPQPNAEDDRDTDEENHGERADDSAAEANPELRLVETVGVEPGPESEEDGEDDSHTLRAGGGQGRTALRTHDGRGEQRHATCRAPLGRWVAPGRRSGPPQWGEVGRMSLRRVPPAVGCLPPTRWWHGWRIPSWALPAAGRSEFAHRPSCFQR